MRKLPIKAQIFLVLMNALGLASLVASQAFLFPFSYSKPWEVGAFLVLAIVAGGQKINVSRKSANEGMGSMSVGYAITFAALVSLGPALAVLVSIATSFSSCLFPKRQAAHQVAFNVSLSSFEALIGGWVFYELNGENLTINPVRTFLAMSVSALVFFLVNTAGVAEIISLCTKGKVLSVWRENFLWTAPSYLASASVSALALLIFKENLASVILFLIPIVYFIHQSYKTYIARASEKEEHIASLEATQSRLIQEIEERSRAEKRLKDALEEAQQLSVAAQEASRVKSQFLANMSHEIRTPMNGVIGLTSLLLETYLDATQRDYAESIDRSAKSLLDIINDILDFTKADSGKLRLVSEKFSLAGVIEEAGEILAHQLEEKNVELVLQVAEVMDFELMGDAGRIRQIIVNLVSNAIKFTEVGEVTVSARIASLTNSIASVELTVTDTGIGIPLEQQGSIFDSFSQADGTSTRKYGGTGLGLSICKQLTNLMGGTIKVESVAGSGSTFAVILPLEISTSTVAFDFQTLRDKRILFVGFSHGYQKKLEQLSTKWQSIAAFMADPREVRAHVSAADRQFLPKVLVIDLARCQELSEEWLSWLSEFTDDVSMGVVGVTSYGNHAKNYDSIGIKIKKPMSTQGLYRALQSAIFTDEKTVKLRSGVSNDAEREALPAKILLVDDNKVNLMVARRLIEQLGCKVQAAENGLRAAELAAENDYDLIFMDIQMPVLDGYGATAQIRSFENSKREVPIVAMTANAMVGDREKCLEAGMNDYIAKPVSKDRISAVVRKWTADSILANAA